MGKRFFRFSLMKLPKKKGTKRRLRLFFDTKSIALQQGIFHTLIQASLINQKTGFRLSPLV